MQEEIIEQPDLGAQDNEGQQGEQTQPENTGPALFDDVEEIVDNGGEGQQEGEGAQGADQPQRESLTFRKLREISNAALKDKRRLERELEEIRAKLPQEKPQLGAKPTLDQYDYDESRFSEAYDKWMEQKVAQDRADQEKLNAQRREQEELENFKKSYKARADALGVDDFQEAEAEVGGILNQTQSGLLMRGADDPATLVYALSKSPERLIELSKISDPVKFTVAIAKLELNLTTRKQSRPAPEPRVSSERSSSSGVASSSQLDRLREKAARTGDYSEVVAYKKQHNIR